MHTLGTAGQSISFFLIQRIHIPMFRKGTLHAVRCLGFVFLSATLICTRSPLVTYILCWIKKYFTAPSSPCAGHKRFKLIHSASIFILATFTTVLLFLCYDVHKPGYQPTYGGQAGQLEIGHGPYPSIGAGGTISPQVQQWFSAVDKDRSGFITAAELKSALVNAQGQTFSETACNLMIGMFDKDRSGHINLEEFDKLYTYINQWLAVFKTYDKDQSGHIDEQELSQALSQMGFRFTPEFINFLTKRCDPRGGKISVDHFIVLCVQVQRFTEAFRVRDTQQNGTVTIAFEDFLNIALSCSI